MAEIGPVAAIRLFVLDLEAAVSFYGEALGLERIAGDPGYGVFDAGGPSLIVEKVGPDDVEDRALVGRFSGLSFAEDDVAEAYARLRNRGVRFQAPPSRQPWGGTLAHFEDPAGNVLTIVEYPR